MKIPPRARAYLYGICAAAGIVYGAALAWLITSGAEDLRDTLARPEMALVLVQLMALSVVAQHFPLAIGPKRKYDLSQVVHLALLLLAGTPLAVVLAGGAEAMGQGSYLVRRDAQGRHLRGVNSVVFNTAQFVLGTAFAGWARWSASSLLWGVQAEPLGVNLATLAGVLAAGTGLYLFNSAAVAVMVSLHGGKSPLEVWRQGRRWNAAHSAGLLTLGALTAHIAEQSPWVPLAMALPAALTYASMRRTAQAEAAISLRDEFLGVAAHELRTPLTSLRGYAQLLVGQAERDGKVDPAKLARSLRTIDRQSAKLCELIDQLLDLSRLQARNLALEKRPFDLVELARDVAASLQPLVPGFTLSVRAPGSVLVEADRLRLEQVITNLINNAARHAGSGERIELEVAGPSRGAGVTLAVRDYGVGIPAQYRDRIFDRFYQIGPESKAGGLGLGLYITRQIVELHGGRVHAECPPEGGTRFVVQLPAPAAQPVPLLAAATVAA
jgi:signal transduction histidine kinase